MYALSYATEIFFHFPSEILATSAAGASIASADVSAIVPEPCPGVELKEASGSFPPWESAPAEAQLERDSAHVWLLPDDAMLAAVERSGVLAQDEQQRAERLAAPRSRSYIATRVALRIILARYTGRAAADIVFEYGPLGKPSFPQGGVNFSISHAGDRALLAFSASHRIGIDLEHVRRARRFDALSARFFSDANARIIARASPSALPRIFAQAWAQREAYVKCVGGGLYATPDHLPFMPGEIPLTPLTLSDGSTWTVGSLGTGSAYEARLVAEGGLATVRAFTTAFDLLR